MVTETIDQPRLSLVQPEQKTEDKSFYNLIAGMEKSKRVPRLTFEFSDGNIVIEPYCDIARISGHSDGNYITFCVSERRTILCAGKNLTRLIPYLQREVIGRLYCYRSQIHRMGEDTANDMPVIHQIYEEAE